MCVAHSSGGWTSEVRVPARWEEGPLLGHRHLMIFSHDRRAEGDIWDLFHMSTNPNHKGSSLMIKSLPKAPTCHCYHLQGLGFQHTNFAGRTQSDHSSTVPLTPAPVESALDLSPLASSICTFTIRQHGFSRRTFLRQQIILEDYCKSGAGRGGK